MSNYPDLVATITSDYLARLKAQLRLVPVAEQQEFLKEIESHIYEAYQQTPGDDELARILAVLRKLGEPADVVSDRLAESMMRSGTRRNLPLFVLGGIVIALFGLPLGFGGVGVLIGILGTLAGLLVAFYATSGAVLLTGALLAACGLARLYQPELWERLLRLGVIRMDAQVGDFMYQLSPGEQGVVMLMLGLVLLAAGVGMLRLGKHLVRGLRFLGSLVFDWMRQTAQRVRSKLRQLGMANKGLRVHPPENPSISRS